MTDRRTPRERHCGRTAARHLLSVVSGLAVGASVAMAAAPAWALDEAAVTESEAGNLTVYRPVFFTEFRPNSARDMISRLPGFAFDGGSSARGFSGSAGNVLIDGERPPSRGDSLGDILSRIPAGTVQRIEVIRGGSPGIDMQGKPIVANVVRVADAGLTGAVNGTLRVSDAGDVSRNAAVQLQHQAGGRLLEGQIKVDVFDGRGEESRLRTDPAGVVIESGLQRESNEFRRIEATGAIEQDLFGGRIRANAQANARSNDYDNREELMLPVGEELNSGGDEGAGGEVGLRFSRDIGEYGLEVVGYQSLDHATFENRFDGLDYTSGAQTTRDSGESIGSATVRLPEFDTIVVETGAEVVFNFLETDRTRTLNGAPFTLSGDAIRVEELRSEAFATATWTPAPTFNAEFGARYEWSQISAEGSAGDSEKTLGYLKPRVNLTWSPGGGGQLGLRVERQADQLSFDAFSSSASFENNILGVGNPEIEPEKSWIFDARYEHQFGGQNSLVVRYVRREVEDVLGRVVIVQPATVDTPEVRYEITRNGGTETRDHLELDGSMTLDRFGMAGGILTAGVDLRDSETIDPVTLERRRVSGDLRWNWNAGLSQIMFNGDFRWSLHAHDDAEREGFSPRTLSTSGDDVFVSANFSWKPADNWTVGGEISNITGSESYRGVTVFDTSRDIGSPLYVERTDRPAERTMRLSVRRNF